MANPLQHIQPRIFISHQWRDKQVADRLARDLESMAEVWIDFRALRPGDRIQATIDQVLTETDMVLLLWSEHAAQSSGVQAEIDGSLQNGTRIVPCILTRDENGRTHPPLPSTLRGILGIDFDDYATGLAQLAEMILHLQRERLPDDVRASVAENPAARMVEYLRGYLHFLANYRPRHNVSDARAEWVDRIISEIERYVRAGGKTQTVEALLQAARNSNVRDAEGIGMLISRLEVLLGRSPTSAAGADPAPADPPPAAPYPPQDELSRRVRAVAPPGSAEVLLQQVDLYLQSSPVALQALTSYVWSTGSPAGAQVVSYLQNYLAEADDLIPDHQGQYGRLDDAWLILNTAFRLVESGVLPGTAVPVDWMNIVRADGVVRAVIPPAALEALSTAVFQMLQLIAAEVSSYQPLFERNGRGYTPAIPSPSATGGSWEDQMNNALLGTGISVYDYQGL